MYLADDWRDLLKDEIEKDYFSELSSFISEAYKNERIHPNYDDIFRAFNLMQVTDIKVVIVGQDPYHGENQANGLAFSVKKDMKIPPSLKNIYKELISDMGCCEPANGDLTSWAEQGVFLINSVLTVEHSKANSHKNRGWELFTDALIQRLSVRMKNIVFILWGAPSHKKEHFIDTLNHLVIKAPHPSPLSAYRGFFGSKPFSQTNSYLLKNSKEAIEWSLECKKNLNLFDT